MVRVVVIPTETTMQLEYSNEFGLSQTLTLEAFTEDGSGNVIIVGANRKMIEYLLQYGWDQSLQDCIAGRAKKVRDEYAAKGVIDQDEIDLAVAADLEAALTKRAKAIVDGTVRERGSVGPRSETLFRQVAKEFLAKAAKAVKKKLPTDKAKYKALFETFVEKNRAVIQAEVDRRKTDQTVIEL